MFIKYIIAEEKTVEMGKVSIFDHIVSIKMGICHIFDIFHAN